MQHGSDFGEFLIAARGYSPRTAEVYLAAVDDLGRFLRTDDPAAVTMRDLDRYMARLGIAGVAPSTRRARAYGLRSFFKFLHTRGFIPENPARDLRPPRERRSPISVLTPQEMTQIIFEFPEAEVVRGRRESEKMFARRGRFKRARWVRDNALLGLTYACALRADEVGNLLVSDYRVDGKGVAHIFVAGKSAKETSRLRVDKKVAVLVETWLHERATLGLKSAFLFCRVVPSGRAREDHGVTRQMIAKIILERVAGLGIGAKGRRLSPHALRYSRATHMYERGVRELEIQRALRHASLKTTEGYIRRGSGAAMDSRSTRSLPWNAPVSTLLTGDEGER